MNFQQSYLYWLAGLILLIVAVMSFRDKANPRRITTGLFWGVYGLIFLLGDWTYQLVGDKRTVHIAVGLAVVGLALIAGFGGVRLGSYHQRKPEEREASAKRLGQREAARQPSFLSGVSHSCGDGGGRADVQPCAWIAGKSVRTG